MGDAGLVAAWERDEFYGHLEAVGLNAGVIRQVIRRPEWARRFVEALHDFKDQLVPISGQLENLKNWNATYGWGLSADELASVDTTDQADLILPSGLDLLYAESGSLTENLQRWLKVGVDQGSLDVDQEENITDIRLWEGARVYTPGVHRVRIDLSAYSGQDSQSTMAAVREQAHRRKQHLAQAEILAAFAHFPELATVMAQLEIRELDLGGYVATIDNSATTTHVPYLGLPSSRLGARFGYATDDYDMEIISEAAPVVVR